MSKKEETLYCKRFIELSWFAYEKDCCFYTDFLNLNELNLFYQTEKEFAPSCYRLWGGFQGAERKMVCFYPASSYDEIPFPIQTVRIEPIQLKFSDKLTHRDYLGAILNLGIERNKIGDILVEDTGAFVFLKDTIEEFLTENLTKIKHTSMKCSHTLWQDKMFQPRMTERKGTVSSLRLDAVLSAACHASRNSLTALIAGGKVFVNGRMIVSNRYVLKEGDVISVRGYGKFIYQGINHQTKKGRYSITILEYS